MWVAEGLHNTQVMAYTKGREMAGTCKYCGFSGTNDDMMLHAGEDCQSWQEDRERAQAEAEYQHAMQMQAEAEQQADEDARAQYEYEAQCQAEVEAEAMAEMEAMGF